MAETFKKVYNASLQSENFLKCKIPEPDQN